MSEGAQSAVQTMVSEESEDLDTARLVAQAQEGNRAAFTALYERYFDRVYAYLRVALKDAQEAEDATQQVFTQALIALPSYELRAQPWRAWLFRIARNQALDHLRKRGRVEVEEPGAIERRRQPVGPGELRALQWTSDDELVLLIERLPEAQRQVLALRYLLGFSGPEIAEVLDRSPGAVRQLHHRALRFLEQRLAALGREPGETRGRRLPMRGRGRQGPLRPAHGFTLARLTP